MASSGKKRSSTPTINFDLDQPVLKRSKADSLDEFEISQVDIDNGTADILLGADEPVLSPLSPVPQDADSDSEETEEDEKDEEPTSPLPAKYLTKGDQTLCTDLMPPPPPRPKYLTEQQMRMCQDPDGNYVATAIDNKSCSMIRRYIRSLRQLKTRPPCFKDGVMKATADGKAIYSLPLNGRWAKRGEGESTKRGLECLASLRSIGITEKPTIALLKDCGFGNIAAKKILKENDVVLSKID